MEQIIYSPKHGYVKIQRESYSFRISYYLAKAALKYDIQFSIHMYLDMLFKKDIMWFDWGGNEVKPLAYEYYRDIIEMAVFLFGSIADFTRVFTSQTIFYETIMNIFIVNPDKSERYVMVRYNEVNYLVKLNNRFDQVLEVLNLCNMHYLSNVTDEFNNVSAIVKLIL